MLRQHFWLTACAIIALALVGKWGIAHEPPAAEDEVADTIASSKTGAAEKSPNPIKPAQISPFVTKGIEWLIAAQHPDGGWGGGSHAHQDIRDPHQVATDPGTTAFTLLSLLRAGHTPASGQYQSHVRRGLEYLIMAVEKAPAEGPRITDLTGTQPQTKLGQNVDTPLTAQYLARVIDLIAQDDELHIRADAALDKCLSKLQASQEADGGWGQGGGWAPVLQSSLSCSALEIAQANGKLVDKDKLAKARDYQKNQVVVSAGGAVARTEAAAGVELYAFNGAFRGNAAEARQAQSVIQDAITSGALPGGAEVSQENLRAAGLGGGRARKLAKAVEQNEEQLKRLDDENLLAGFGNNGGEEFLSYLLTSESLVIAGGDKFHRWNDKMHGRLQKIQNGDGSWSGHHCISSPVFCTAAVVQCLTTDRDAAFLVAMAERTRASDDEKTSVAKK
jgi:hypothetical protein